MKAEVQDILKEYKIGILAGGTCALNSVNSCNLAR
jgi:hypothetical protein